MTPAPVPPDGEKWDASNCVRFCDRCDAEYGITAGADAGDDACAGCGNLTAPHIYPHPRFAAGRAAATPDPPCAHGLTGGRGAAERCLECGASVTAASPDERLREALTFYADAGNYVGGEVGWWGADHRGEPVWCMDFGSIARNALAADREAPDEPKGQKITHGRHCTCTPCAVEDWTNPAFTPCGMHGKDCPQEYQPLGPAGSFAPPADEPKETT